MKRMRIIHKTGYFYNRPVKFDPHRAMMRPREGHDAHIARARVKVEPRAEVSWLRDTYDNSIAILTFQAASDKLSVESEVDVDPYYDSLNEWPISPHARSFPFQYPPEEHIDLMVYRLPSYPYDGPMLHGWLQDLYQPGQVVNTLDLLSNLNSHIYRSFKYDSREAHGVQLPNETLTRGSGTCRDFAVFMMEAARYWGFGARFVTGYIQMAEGQHGATHAWTEIYIPGAGWRGFDPTNNKLVGSEHIPVGVSREQEKASPLSGSWEGPSDAFDGMTVSVQVVEAT
jgi:Bacterial transglutaminase-like N-terminal region/Transglutaminase-like superfamily